MKDYSSNNAFLSWEGTINRKDYVINMLIMLTLFFGIFFIRFDVLAPQKILYLILTYMVSFLQFIILISILSVIYRRINDFSIGRSYDFRNKMNTVFGVLFVFPVLYFYIFAYFLSFLQSLISILNILACIAIIIGIVAAVVFAFIKSK